MSEKSHDPNADQKPSKEFKRFEKATKAILKVPKSEIDKRIAKDRRPSS